MIQEPTHTVPWRGQRASFDEALHYLNGRLKGEIRSIKTPWLKFNDATVDGIEWNSATVIGGRPATGKTLIKDQLIREAFVLNPGEDFRVLEFQLEMVGRVSAIREYSSVLGESYKYLCSAAKSKIGTVFTKEQLDLCEKYSIGRLKYPIDIVEKPPTVSEFKEIIHQYMDHFSAEGTSGKKVYKKTIVTLDHSLLLKKDKWEKDKFDVLYSLGEALTEMKRIYPIAFIILSQLNRDIDKPERNENGKYGNHILESDIFGADALLQHADTLIGLNRPGKQKITEYGPDRYLIDSETILVMHFLKCRNGDARMSFFRTEFEKMQIVEIEPPPRKDRRLRV